jgi:hypothetical protein
LPQGPSKLCRRVLPSFATGSFQALSQGWLLSCRAKTQAFLQVQALVSACGGVKDKWCWFDIHALCALLHPQASPRLVRYCHGHLPGYFICSVCTSLASDTGLWPQGPWRACSLCFLLFCFWGCRPSCLANLASFFSLVFCLFGHLDHHSPSKTQAVAPGTPMG